MNPHSRLIVTCLALACAFGLVLDGVSVFVCPTYFRTAGIRSLLLRGLFWGLWEVAWLGAVIGVGLAVLTRFGSPPHPDPEPLRRTLLRLAPMLVLVALLGGALGYLLPVQPITFTLLTEQGGETLELGILRRYQAVYVAHQLPYALVVVVTLGLFVRVLRQRWQESSRVSSK